MHVRHAPNPGWDAGENRCDGHGHDEQQVAPGGCKSVADASRRKYDPEADAGQRCRRSKGRSGPQLAIDQDVLADPVHRAKDHGQDGCLHAKEQGSEDCAAEIKARVEPGEREHQDQAWQHEAQSGEQAADPALGADAQVDAELVRLGSGQRLHDGQQAVETGAADPSLFVDQLAPDHGDLCDRAAECQEAEAEEPNEQGQVAEVRRTQIRLFAKRIDAANH